MNRRGFLKTGIAGITGLSLTTNPFNVFANDNFVNISILHTNDLHCHIEPFGADNQKFARKGGLARISSMVKQIKAENKNILLFDAGDMFQGTPYYNYFKGDLIMQLMSEVGYDAGTIGNHEFDDGLQGILNSLPFANFPVINSNYDFSNTILAGKFPRWKIFKKSGIKIGVYGLGVELNGLVTNENFGNTIYNDPLKTAIEIESFLKNEKKCDLVICLSHLGFQYRENKVSDLILATETFMTDLIIGGHTHTFLEEPVLKKNKAGNQVIVNQASWGGMVLGKIDFTFEQSGNKKMLAAINNISIENES